MTADVDTPLQSTDRRLIRQRTEIERLAHDVDYRLLRNIPGIGLINALTILAEARRPASLPPSTPVPEVLRPRPRHPPIGHVPRPHQAVQVRQRAPAPHLLDGCPIAARQRDNSFRDKLGRYVAAHADDANTRRKAMTALTAKMARVAHALVKTETEYRPFLERSNAGWKGPSLQVS